MSQKLSPLIQKPEALVYYCSKREVLSLYIHLLSVDAAGLPVNNNGKTNVLCIYISLIVLARFNVITYTCRGYIVNVMGTMFVLQNRVASSIFPIHFDCDTYQEAMREMYAWEMRSSACQTKCCSIK